MSRPTGGLRLRVLGSVVPVLAAATALTGWLQPVILALPEGDRALGRLDLVVLVSAVALATFVLASVLVSRTRGIEGAAPPLEAIRATHALPRRLATGAALFGSIACAVDLVLRLVRGTPASVAGPFVAFSLAQTLLACLAGYAIVRSIVRPVLARIPAARLPDPGARRGSVHGKLLVAIAIPIGSTAAVTLLLGFRHADEASRRADHALRADLATIGARATGAAPTPVRPWALAAAVLGATAVALGIGSGAARRAATDLASTAAAIDRLVERDARDRAPRRPAFRDLADLVSAVEALAVRYAQMHATTESALDARQTAQRVKTQFLASMSHDLRSPLNSIIGFSELLLRGVEGELSPTQRETIGIVKQSGEDLLRLINDILDSARIEAGRMDVERRWTPSVSLVTDTLRRARELVGPKPIELLSELQPGLPPVFVDADRIAQALFNLLSNAVKFMERGTIRVRAAVSEGPPGPPGRYLRVEVADTGAGIAEEDRDSIFRTFHQVDSGSSRRVGGMGLGLSLAKSLVELQGGRIWLESRIGEGSVFYVALPLIEGPHAPPDEPPRPSRRTPLP
jgi:signal transduction histidine kinase